MKGRSFIRGIVAGWILVIVGALWCMQVKKNHVPAEAGLPGSIMFITGVLWIRSGIRRRRRQNRLLEYAEIVQRVGYSPSSRVE